jgi:AraC-like DNA-binding protein
MWISPMSRNQLRILRRTQAYLPLDSSGAGVLRVAEVDWGPGSVNISTRNDFTVIRYITKGCLQVDSSPGIKAGPDTVLIHPSGETYRQRVVSDEPCHLFLVNVVGVEFSQRWGQVFGPAPLVLPAPVPDEMEHLCRAMLARARDDDGMQSEECRQLLEPIVACCRRRARRAGVQQGAADRRDMALRALSANLSEDLSIAGLATETGVNRATLHRWCRERHGCSPRSYRQRARLAEAARQLSESDAPVHVIAEAVGFSCPFAFSKAFRRQYGLPPSRCRQ